MHAKGDCQDLADSQADRQHGGQGAGTAGIFEVSCPFGGGGGHPGADHDVAGNYWNVHRYKDDNSRLWDGAIDWENFRIVVKRVIDRYFKQPNYLK